MNGPPPSPTASNSPSEDNRVPAARPLNIPDYELLRRIGSGSYGDVWLARNVLGQFRAVKIIYRHCFADPRPFEREFEGIQRFKPISRSHPSQLHILHVGKDDAEGCFYYVMELADAAGAPRVDNGSELKVDRGVESRNAQPSTLDAINYLPHTLRHDLERHGRLPIADCVQIGLSLTTALAHLHEQGLVHRDIKPSNIIFVKGVAKLGDIGLVTEAGDTQSIVGTEGYLPPEGPGTPQADLYSLGKVLYEISTGMDRRRFAALPEESWNWPDRDQLMEFNEIVLKACAKDAAQRYETAEQLRIDLALLQEGKSVRRTRAAQRRQSFLMKFMMAVAVSIAVAVGVTAIWGRLQEGSVNPSDRRSKNVEANQEYAEGVYCARRDTVEGMEQSIAHFNRAIQIDPKFVMACNGLYEVALAMQDGSEMRRRVAQMIGIEPNLAEAHAGLCGGVKSPEQVARR